MKITCTTERVITKKESCRKEYCCNRLKIAMNSYKVRGSSYDYLASHFELGKDKILLETHSSYRDVEHDMPIDFCPWCGKPLVIEHRKVDKTGLPPRPRLRPKPKPELKLVLTAAPPKKKRWWNR